MTLTRTQMVVQVLDLLVMHVTWKTDGIPQSSTYSAEDEKFCEVLRRQRDTILEVFSEYAVGTSSNACENVRRTVCRSYFS